ncbi:MAG: hypothetical protein FJ008_09830 [Chloroflexi bacterium]|nr:hypothetical protein [Chloroflexota bacterium]MBM3176181.1 hypothetical protein [Chloroflexota bacterium]MBM4450573.1 hypothetical protein [Chloroflexota bacterium]
MTALRNAGAVFLAVLASALSPLLIWVAFVAALRQAYAEWRVTRAQLLAGNIACSIHDDCPPGYECLGGRCVPVWAK